MDLRRIDAMVAEHIFDLTVDYEFADAPNGYRVPALADRYDDWGALPYYCSDIAAAWEVVEKLKMYEPEISWNDEERGWHVRFQKDGTGHNGFDASAPMAISIAALQLKGKGVSVEG